MKTILNSYKTLYHQIINELAINNLSKMDRRILIETLYNTERAITQIEIELS